jgi:hypothetical protein
VTAFLRLSQESPDLSVPPPAKKKQRKAKRKTAGDHSFGTVLLNKSIKECSFAKLMEKMQVHFTYVLCQPFLLRACLYLCLASFLSARSPVWT